ncbi:probable serine/threonine-protein kinase SIS8 [Aristolochia californica]|uniref:probable serine/threonine-protein kinase SIS8 n=1 Tax=Aristolochia californica TaxID=171875 RepID=UPI0035D9306B
MRNFLKKLHIVSNQSELAEGSSSRGSKFSECASGKSSPSRSSSDQKPLSGLTGWLTSAATRHSSSPPSSSQGSKDSKKEPQDSTDRGSELARQDSGSSNSRGPELEEEYQIQIALELSAREDPEAVQIEAVKQISLGSFPPQNTPAEVVAYRYWNYNALGYDDKILDGFYDLYGVLADSTPDKMPSLIDLQRLPISDSISWEAILVNRGSDSDLLRLEQRALAMALESRSGSRGVMWSDLVQKLAILVADYMGGPVEDPEKMLKIWRSQSNHLRSSVGNRVLPLGQLKIGLARHRALLFKVLTDSVGLPCRLVKGQQYTGLDDVAMNIVKIDDGRRYIVDLMADPGTLIPSDAAEPKLEFEEPFLTVGSLRDYDHSKAGLSSSCLTFSTGGNLEHGHLDKKYDIYDFSSNENSMLRSPHKDSLSDELKTDYSRQSDGCEQLHRGNKALIHEPPNRRNYPFKHARSPSWTEGVSSPAVRRMKVKDVSQYMIDAAKENPQLAQKLHDVLLESGVVAPPNLFTEIYSDTVIEETTQSGDELAKKNRKSCSHQKPHVHGIVAPGLPPLPYQPKPSSTSLRPQPEPLKPVMGLGVLRQVNSGDLRNLPSSSESEESPPTKFVKNMPMAAAAAATAAVVASSMVVAVAKSNADSNLEVPMAAAAAVVATTAAVSRQYEQLDSSCLNQIEWSRKSGEGNGGSGDGPHGCGLGRKDGFEWNSDGNTGNLEGERISDKSTENKSAKLDVTLDDVSEWEIQWEEITMGERIGLGSYGEVYRGEWHGTEVAVKRFLDQDISGDALAEFRSEVRIMKRLRHPNVVLFMGAVTRAPNLSIVTEFLPRGSLYRLIHRPNNQLEERRCLRMALDVARGMNYLHNCTPVIVHRDLKSPNLLVDKNWVVKVCDFGLSRMKHNTFLSSRSTVGTAEWMAPEVLRNEPSDEKCDVYSFGVILWELSTLQQPWGGMNPMQVVGAVGFQHRCLDIPDDMDPAVAAIIKRCWQTDPKLRPSFSEIMGALKPLQKPITNTQVPRPRAPAVTSTDQEKGGLSQRKKILTLQESGTKQNGAGGVW